GIHVDDLDMVVNVDPPMDHKDYLHRGGRTARPARTESAPCDTGPATPDDRVGCGRPRTSAGWGPRCTGRRRRTAQSFGQTGGTQQSVALPKEWERAARIP
ncbi:helicase-related protein, partial [Streptomyces sp. NPDC096068]|uniref:helicase-related protein n=1 Tax=Streptomyces sp. NPDC096068 TaxID=3155424 RepID=UPI0033307FE4